MYCPLCKAEYRDGFYQCSDCSVKLVTREEADASRVVLLWHGTNCAKFDEIVAALRDAGISNMARSAARSEEYGATRLRIPYVSAMRAMKQNMSWEISVLQSDYLRAAELLRQNC